MLWWERRTEACDGITDPGHGRSGSWPLSGVDTHERAATRQSSHCSSSRTHDACQTQRCPRPRRNAQASSRQLPRLELNPQRGASHLRRQPLALIRKTHSPSQIPQSSHHPPLDSPQPQRQTSSASSPTLERASVRRVRSAPSQSAANAVPDSRAPRTLSGPPRGPVVTTTTTAATTPGSPRAPTPPQNSIPPSTGARVRGYPRPYRSGETLGLVVSDYVPGGAPLVGARVRGIAGCVVAYDRLAHCVGLGRTSCCRFCRSPPCNLLSTRTEQLGCVPRVTSNLEPLSLLLLEQSPLLRPAYKLSSGDILLTYWQILATR